MNSIVKYLYEHVDVNTDGEDVEEMNTTSSAGGEYATPNAFASTPPSKKDKARKKKRSRVAGYMEDSLYEDAAEKIFDKISNQIDSITEISYRDYKSDPSTTAKQKINAGIKEVSSKLYEMERNLSRMMKLKTEIGADQSIFLKGTVKKFTKISERLLRLSSSIREFSK